MSGGRGIGLRRGGGGSAKLRGRKHGFGLLGAAQCFRG